LTEEVIGPRGKGGKVPKKALGEGFQISWNLSRLTGLKISFNWGTIVWGPLKTPF